MANIDPVQLLQMKKKIDKFREAHPKFPLFLKAAGDNGIKEGTVIEFKVTAPDGSEYDSNIRLNADDVELIDSLRGLFGIM